MAAVSTAPSRKQANASGNTPSTSLTVAAYIRASDLAFANMFALDGVFLGTKHAVAAYSQQLRLELGRLYHLEEKYEDAADCFAEVVKGLADPERYGLDENTVKAILDMGPDGIMNQALMYGFDAAGVELDRKDFEAYATFIQRWVKDKRLKHQAHVGQVKGHPRLALDIGLDKESFKAGKALHLAVVNAGTQETTAAFPPRSFDLVVTDAPYGVQHGSHGAKGELSRSPLELVAQAAPIWRDALRPGGAMGIAWNVHVARREAVCEALARAGLEVFDGPAYRGFEHRVDQAILRDVVVARRAG